MIINLQIGYTDNTTKEIAAKASDIVAFEDRFDISMANLQNEVRLTDLLFLAWEMKISPNDLMDLSPRMLFTLQKVYEGHLKRSNSRR